MRIFKTPRFFAWFFPKRTWGFSRDVNSVYLTFDDGPNPEITVWILDFLKEKNLKATFFCVGANVVKYPEVYQRILEEGHSVGNHSFRHQHYYKTSRKEYLEGIEESSKVIQSKLYRPPYGRMGSIQSRRLSKKYNIVMWTWLSYDFDPQVPLERILQSAQKDIRKGSILVLHDNPKVTQRVKALLPPLVDIIQEKNLDFKPISF